MYPELRSTYIPCLLQADDSTAIESCEDSKQRREVLQIQTTLHIDSHESVKCNCRDFSLPNAHVGQLDEVLQQGCAAFQIGLF